MNSGSSRPKAGLLIVYLVIMIMVFFCGTGIGLLFSGWWAETSRPTSVAFFTVTPGSPQSTLMGTTSSSSDPAADGCAPPPAGWMAYTVQSGDTLSEFTIQFQISEGRLMRANCLTSPDLQAGQQLYLPPPATPQPCLSTPPAGWGPYTIQSGDTLSALAAERSVTVDHIKQINCLSSENLVQGQLLHIPILPTPTPCQISPPASWESYAVQSGDTLFGIASARGTTVAEVMRVNCLTSDSIQIHQTTLYLPPLPTPTPSPTTPPPTPLPPPPPPAPQSFPGSTIGQPPGLAPQPPTVGVIDSVFGRQIGLLSLALASGSPNAPANPCDNKEKPATVAPGDPWIDARSLLSEHRVEYGEQVFFFACDFTKPALTPEPAFEFTAKTIWRDRKEYPTNIQFYIPPYDYEGAGSAEGVIVWSARCDLDEGDYTLVVEGQPAQSAVYTFTLEVASSPQILVVPPAASAGSIFDIYYCGFKASANTEISVELYYQTARRPKEPITENRAIWGYLASWKVPINPNGKAKQTLPSSIDDPGGRYLFTYDFDNDGIRDGEKSMWLLR
ncbi:MAG: LysM peptidoglycan-binding domain-containing protein [Anaerolineae bacterium]|nr:LysM peptidoglycan-binding domain-containing protein [Anaerolineae bacterium]